MYLIQHYALGLSFAEKWVLLLNMCIHTNNVLAADQCLCKLLAETSFTFLQDCIQAALNVFGFP